MTLPDRNISPLTILGQITPSWRGSLVQLAMAWAAIFLLFAPDWVEMFGHWWNSSTYNHILLIPLILLWLVAQRAPQLALLSPRIWWPGLLAILGALFIWLLGEVAGIATASHLGVVALLQASVLTFLGPRVSLALLFPLFYSLFLVPIGEELVPTLQMITADITIWLTRLSGIPAVVEGVFIDTPAGLFEVAEACSGVKFLIAMIALGALVAHLCYRALPRRIAFMALAIVLPILANGVRAWGTIFLAQKLGLEFAAGFDHILYGWVFFGLVMVALLAAGWRFMDRGIDEPAVDVERLNSLSWMPKLERHSASGWKVFCLFGIFVLGIFSWANAAANVEARLPQVISLPEIEGWTRNPFYEDQYPWEPRMGGADRKLLGSYTDELGRRVDVVFALYAAQGEGREAGAHGEGALPPETEWRWLQPSSPIEGGAGDRLQALGSIQRETMSWFSHGGWTGGSRSKLKLMTIQDRLFFRENATGTLIISSVQNDEYSARRAIVDFHKATMPIGDWMDQISGLEPE